MSGVRSVGSSGTDDTLSTFAELKSGELLADKYRLLHPLGEGGMGSVWVAHSEALDIRVAVKVIKAEVSGMKKERVAERLLQEARAAARLGHPAIVRISDFGKTASGNPFIVMELLEGEDLGSAIQRRGRMNPVVAVRTLLPIGHALAAAHDKSIIHRDLKPENILLALQEDGSIQPKLIDFGIAKVENQANERITAAGAVMGSPGYLSPEQARGDDVDARSDVWSFCVVLYEMITGDLPFQGKNNYALLRAIIEQDVTPITKRGVPEEALWTILGRGLAKSAAQRWPSMRSLGVALAGWLLDQGITEDICGSSLESAWIRKRDRNSLPDAISGSYPRLSLPGGTPVPDRDAATLESGPQPISQAPATLPSAPPAPQRTKPAWPLLLGGAALLIGIGGIWMARASSDGEGAKPATEQPRNDEKAATTPPPPPATAAATTEAAPSATVAAASASSTASASLSAAAKAAPPARPKQPAKAQPEKPAPAPAPTPTGPGLKKPTF